MPKKKDYKFEVTLRFISDPGHGWAEVPAILCRALELDEEYTRRDGWCYLEEDCEAYDLEQAAARHGVTIHFTEVEVEDFDAWLDSKQWPAVSDEAGQ